MANEKITCSQCGSNLITIIDENYAKCESCGTKIKIEKSNDVTSTIIVKHVGKKEEKSPEINFIKIKEKNKIEDFTRKAYVDLFTSDVSDAVCSATFSPAVTQTKNYLLISGEYDINYKVNLGFDRTDTYLGLEKIKNQNGTYTEQLVEKERVVTDWKPTSGTFKSKNNAVYETGRTLFSEDLSSKQKRFEKIVLNGFLDNVEEIDSNKGTKPFTIEQSDLKKAYDWGAELANVQCEISLGKGKKKDYSYTYEEKPDAITGIISNEFVLPYQIGTKKYEVTSFSNKIDTYCKGPIDTTEKEILNKNLKKAKKSLFIPTLTLFSILFLIVFIVMLSQKILFPIAIIASIFVAALITIIPFIIWTKLHSNAWTSITKKETQIKKRESEAKKHDCLTKLLKEMDFAPLTEEEKLKFSFLNKKDDDAKPIEKFVLWIEKLSFKKNK